MTATTPSSPAYREGASIWVWDDAGRFAFPRIGVEAVGRDWETAFGISLCMGMPGGRLLLANRDEPPLPVGDSQGRPRVLGAGPMRFECLAPLTHWRVTFAGDVLAIDVDDFLAAGHPRPVASDRTEAARAHARARRARRRTAVGAGNVRTRRRLGAGRAALGAVVLGDGHGRRRRSRDAVHRWRPPHSPQGREPQRLRRLPRAQLAVRRVPERPGLRIHPLPPAARRLGEVPRGLAPRRRRDPARARRGHAVDDRPRGRPARTSPSRCRRRRGPCASRARRSCRRSGRRGPSATAPLSRCCTPGSRGTAGTTKPPSA